MEKGFVCILVSTMGNRGLHEIIEILFKENAGTTTTASEREGANRRYKEVKKISLSTYVVVKVSQEWMKRGRT
jgi:hypothetical protein